MGEVHYMISEAAKRVNVEPHVLRYWEEELTLPIGRTGMGHRYYTKENIQLFDCIKELKEQGLSLKELSGLIPDIIRTKERLKQQKAKAVETAPKSASEAAPETNVKSKIESKIEAKIEAKAKDRALNKMEVNLKDTDKPAIHNDDKTQKPMNAQTELTVTASNTVKRTVDFDQRLEQIQFLIADVVERVLIENNKVLETAVSSNVAKNMNYLLASKERQEEERYHKLDHLIRQQQTMRKEAAHMNPAKRLRRLLGDV